MTWPFTERTGSLTALEILSESRGMRLGKGNRYVARDEALRHSAVWACLRLRADLVSTMPLDVFRRVGDVQVESPKPIVLISPGGDHVDIEEWLYSTQVDLDSCGNSFGIITERAGGPNGLPARIDLVPVSDVIVSLKKGKLGYKVAGETVDPKDVWHEKQFTMAGLPVGLSPIGYAAMSVNMGLSGLEFGSEWFKNSAIPGSRLKNTARVIDPNAADRIKERYKAAIQNGDLFVHGKDWEFEVIGAKASEAALIDQMKFSASDMCRFFGVPGDMVDVDVASGTVTYANITQRNLQLLIMNLNPALRRRESAFSRRLLPQPRYAKFNRAGLLEMDLKTRYEAYKIGIEGKFLTQDEARDNENLAPLEPEQIEKFNLLATKATTPTPQGGQQA